jgi:hypothetical protein
MLLQSKSHPIFYACSARLTFFLVSLPVSLSSWHWALPVSKDTILAKGFIFGFSGKFSHKFVVVKMQPKKSKVRQNEGKSNYISLCQRQLRAATCEV